MLPFLRSYGVYLIGALLSFRRWSSCFGSRYHAEPYRLRTSVIQKTIYTVTSHTINIGYICFTPQIEEYCPVWVCYSLFEQYV